MPPAACPCVSGAGAVAHQQQFLQLPSISKGWHHFQGVETLGSRVSSGASAQPDLFIPGPFTQAPAGDWALINSLNLWNHRVHMNNLGKTFWDLCRGCGSAVVQRGCTSTNQRVSGLIPVWLIPPANVPLGKIKNGCTVWMRVCEWVNGQNCTVKWTFYLSEHSKYMSDWMIYNYINL